MYKRLKLDELEGLQFTQDTLDFMQQSYRDAFAGLSLFLGDFVIVTGVIASGGNYSNGWVAINGELLPFVGGLIAPNIIIEEIDGTEEFADGSNKNVRFIRQAKSANTGGTPIANFVRLKSVKVLTNEVAQALADIANVITNVNNRVAKSGDTMTGALAMSNNKITGLGNGTNTADAVNKGQLDVVGNRPLCVCHARISYDNGIVFNAGPVGISIANMADSGNYTGIIRVTHNLNTSLYTVSSSGAYPVSVINKTDNYFEVAHYTEGISVLGDYLYDLQIFRNQG
jgi:hypothetical protein